MMLVQDLVGPRQWWFSALEPIALDRLSSLIGVQ